MRINNNFIVIVPWSSWIADSYENARKGYENYEEDKEEHNDG